MPWASSCSAALTISLYRAVMAEVNHFGTGRLQNATHDIDRRIMTIEQRCGGHETNLVLGLVRGQLLGDRKIGHDNSLIGKMERRPWYAP